jgi:hypothetical protein
MNSTRFLVPFFVLLVTVCVIRAEMAGTLLEPAKIPIVLNGKEVGSATAPAGTKVKILREEGGKALISTTSGQAWVESGAVHRGDGPAPLPVAPKPTPEPPPKAETKPPSVQRTLGTPSKSGPEKIQIPKEPDEEEVPEFQPTTARPINPTAENPKKKVLVLPPSASGGGDGDRPLEPGGWIEGAGA